MPVDEPSWWYNHKRLPPWGTQRLAGAYTWVALKRLGRGRSYCASMPVICVGNFTAGGTGKTPLSLLIARELQHMRRRPAFLTRGYGGRSRGPRLVAPRRDKAIDVGDEALLLARVAPTLVARNRAKGAAALEAIITDERPDVIIMDDGLQNPMLAKDLSIAVVDGRRGVGNGLVLPAGPLRAPLDDQLKLVNAIVINRPPAHEATYDERSRIENLVKDFSGPILETWPEQDGDLSEFQGERVVAFAGIGHPERFFDMLDQAGADVVTRVAFQDHHRFSETDAAHLLSLATTHAARLVTTEKDVVRLSGEAGSAIARLAADAMVLKMRLSMSEADRGRLRDMLGMLRSAVGLDLHSA